MAGTPQRTRPDMMDRRELPVVATLAVVSATVALAFGRVFGSDRYLAPLLVAALLPHLVSFVARSRGVQMALSWLISLGVLAVYAVFLAPGAGSPDAFLDRLSGGWRVLQHDSVPIRATDGTILLAILVVWLAAALAEELTFRRDASLGALAPGVTILIWIAALGTTKGQWLMVAAFGVASVLFLAVQHQMLLERRRTRLGSRRLFDAPALLLSGAVIGILAVAIGVAAGPALPGGDEPLFTTGGLGRDRSNDSYRTSIPPLLDVSDKLQRGTDEALFTVQADRADYWRIVALDEYRSIGGGQWTLTAEGEEDVTEGLDGNVTGDTLTQRYEIGDLGERWIPAAFRPVKISRDAVLVVRSSSTLVVADSPSVSGLKYTVVSALPVLNISAEQAAATAAPVPARLERYTELPADFPAELRTIAEEQTALAATPYDKAKALRDWFRGDDFTYNADVDLGDSEDGLRTFVVETKEGFCVQFASAYTTMLRALGIPARVAIGFTPGEVGADKRFEVSTWDAHAWPEVWLAGIGWTHVFDPTPQGDARGGSELPNEPDTPTQPTMGTATSTTIVTTPSTSTGGAPTTVPNRTSGGVTVDPSNRDPRTKDGPPWVVFAALAIILLGLSPLGVVLAMKARRRAGRRREARPAMAITGAWAEAIDELTDRRIAWPPSDTPREVARRVPQMAGGATAEPLRALADTYGEVRYGDIEPRPDDARRAWKNVDELRRALDDSSGFFDRLRARVDPGTLRRRRAGAAQSPVPAGWSEPRSPSTND